MSEGLKRYWREVKQLAHDEGIPLNEARMLWRTKKDEEERKNTYGDLDLQVREILDDQEEQDASGVICPYCRCSFVSDEKIITCKKCKTSYHKECAKELKKCATLGCNKKLKKGRRSSETPSNSVPIVIRRGHYEPHPILSAEDDPPTDEDWREIRDELVEEESFFDLLLDVVADPSKFFGLLLSGIPLLAILSLTIYCIYITVDAIMKL